MDTKKKKFNKNLIKELKSIHIRLSNEIQLKLDKFKKIGETGSELELFSEFVFCLFTPQSKAKVCWPVVEHLLKNDLLLNSSEAQLSDEINCVRFRHTKAKNVMAAKKLFYKGGRLSIKSKLNQFKDPLDTRDWLVENVRGMGYKEASHFLRNIGLGEELAILDRHILKNLNSFGVIDNMSKSMSKKRYIEIERQMTEFSKKIKIPMAHLDLLLWYKETGEIYK